MFDAPLTRMANDPRFLCWLQPRMFQSLFKAALDVLQANAVPFLVPFAYPLGLEASKPILTPAGE